MKLTMVTGLIGRFCYGVDGGGGSCRGGGWWGVVGFACVICRSRLKQILNIK